MIASGGGSIVARHSAPARRGAPEDTADFVDYALGTVAFLQGDLSELKAARKRLAKVPEPEWFKKEQEEIRAQTGDAPTWPINLNVLDMLLACWGRPYAVAYQGCQPPKKPKAR